MAHVPLQPHTQSLYLPTVQRREVAMLNLAAERWGHEGISRQPEGSGQA